jgi:hypothetical protein
MGLSTTRRGAVAGAAAAAAAALVLGTPSAAFAQPPSLSITISSPATLLAEGAAARVSVTFTCTSAQASIAVSLAERSGDRIASAFGTGPVTCTGSTQRLTVNVIASTAPLRPGVAFAEASISGCNGDDCGSVRDQRVIRVVR